MTIFNKMYKDNYARTTINKVKVLLTTIFDLAIRNNVVHFNPIPKLKVPLAHKNEVVALTRKQQKLVEQACKEHRYGHMLLFLLFTGLRASEFMNLKWNDFFDNDSNPYIIIRKSKTESGLRLAPLIAPAYEILKSQYLNNAKSPYIFIQGNGKKVTAQVLKRLYLNIRKISKVEHLTNHVCRHTFATRLAEEKINLKALAKLLGHTDERFTIQRYTHADTKYLFDQISLLNNI